MAAIYEINDCKMTVICDDLRSHLLSKGKETAIKLATLGADTVILCRSPEKAQSAVDEIKRKSGSSTVRC
jgi:hypothetical protein